MDYKTSTKNKPNVIAKIKQVTMLQPKSYKQYKTNPIRDAWVKKHNAFQQELRDTRDREILKGIEKKLKPFKENRNIDLLVEFEPSTYLGFKHNKAYLFGNGKSLCELNEIEVEFLHNYDVAINGTDEEIWTFINGKKIIEDLCSDEKYMGDLSFKRTGSDKKHIAIFRNGKKLFMLNRRKIRWLKGSMYKLEG